MREPTIQEVVDTTAEVYGIEPAFILQDTTKKEVVKLRHIAQYLCRLYTTQTFEEIGEQTAHRNHATAIYSYKKISFEYEHYSEVNYLVNKISDRLKERGFGTSTIDIQKH